MERRPVLLALAVAALLWTPPLLEQLSPQGGNLSHILGFSSLPDDRHSAGEALVASGAATLGWLMGARDGFAAGLLVVVVMALAVAHGAGRVTRQAFPVALSLVTFAGIAAALLSAMRVTGALFPYLLRWMAMLGVGAAAALAAGLGPLWRRRAEQWRRPRLAGSAGLIALALVSGRNLALARSVLQGPPPVAAPESQSAARLAEAIDAGIATTSRRPLLEIAPHTDRNLVLGVLLALDKTGTRCAVRPFGPFRLGGHWTPDGTEDARIVVGPEDVELAARPGVRLLGREAGLFAYLVPTV